WQSLRGETPVGPWGGREGKGEEEGPYGLGAGPKRWAHNHCADSEEGGSNGVMSRLRSGEKWKVDSGVNYRGLTSPLLSGVTRRSIACLCLDLLVPLRIE